MPLPAAAQAVTGAFALDRFEPADRGGHWFSLDSLEFNGHLRPVLGLTGDWSAKPLNTYDAGGNERSAIVRDQLFTHLGVSVPLWNRLRVSANLPLLLHSAGRAAEIDRIVYLPPSSAAVGDLRLGADVRVLGEVRGPLQVVVGSWMYVPTVKSLGYASDGRVRAAPRVLAAGELGDWTYAGRLAFAYRSRGDAILSPVVGHELQLGLGVGRHLDERRAHVGLEVLGGRVVGSASGSSTTPVFMEGLVSGRYAITEGVSLGAGVGVGLNRGVGVPKARGLLSIDWAPPVARWFPPAQPILDRDGDGIADADDRCPDQAGVANANPDKSGCPVPADRDGDGIADAEDACPDVAGARAIEADKNGCPEVAAAKPEPVKPGEVHSSPKAQVVGGRIEIREQVSFEADSSELKAESAEVLAEVAEVLKAHPELKVRVEGHTDTSGRAAKNKKLSAQRGAAVVTWLEAHGVERGRLVSRGLGSERPVASNETAEGRSQNRRVEFHIE